jgi:acetyltransferase-like isoleucine patch superfamily enzyme
LGAAEVHGSGRISFGRNLYLYRDLYFETAGDGQIEIGDVVVMSRGVHVVAYGKITIGSGTMVGEYSSIRDANHHFGDDLQIRHSGHQAEPIAIGRNVWIGRGVAILPGACIGDGAVVGANAVVTKNVPPGAVVAGVPARPLAQRLAV